MEDLGKLMTFAYLRLGEAPASVCLVVCVCVRAFVCACVCVCLLVCLCVCLVDGDPGFSVLLKVLDIRW